MFYHDSKQMLLKTITSKLNINWKIALRNIWNNDLIPLSQKICPSNKVVPTPKKWQCLA